MSADKNEFIDKLNIMDIRDLKFLKEELNKHDSNLLINHKLDLDKIKIEKLKQLLPDKSNRVAHGTYSNVYVIGSSIYKVIDDFEIALTEILHLCNNKSCENIIHLENFYLDESAVVLKMKYYENTLSKLILDVKKHKTIKNISINGEFTKEFIYKICRGLANAIVCMYYSGTVHADIKPDNIVLTDDFEPILIDFGLSTFDVDRFGKQFKKSSCVQNTYYRAPEVMYEDIKSDKYVRFCNYDNRIDLWGVGCVIYELLHLNRFSKRKSIDKDHISGIKEGLKNLPSLANNKIEEFMLGCLRYDMDDRIKIYDVEKLFSIAPPKRTIYTDIKNAIDILGVEYYINDGRIFKHDQIEIKIKQYFLHKIKNKYYDVFTSDDIFKLVNLVFSNFISGETSYSISCSLKKRSIKRRIKFIKYMFDNDGLNIF